MFQQIQKWLCKGLYNDIDYIVSGLIWTFDCFCFAILNLILAMIFVDKLFVYIGLGFCILTIILFLLSILLYGKDYKKRKKLIEQGV